jgi:predicted nucleotidyltransferase
MARFIGSTAHGGKVRPAPFLKRMDICSLSDIRTFAQPVFAKSPAQKAFVFGSWSRETQSKRSDIDMMVISKNTQKRFFDRFDDYNSLYDVFGKIGLDLLIYTENELSEMKDRSFVQTVLRQGVVIYER